MPATPKFRFVLLATTALMVCGSPSKAQTASEKSPGEKSATATANPSAKADPDMAKVLAALNQLGPKPIETLTPAEAR
jgi:ABC-type oligopeptide transport system substrate-binding subunit